VDKAYWIGYFVFIKAIFHRIVFRRPLVVGVIVGCGYFRRKYGGIDNGIEASANFALDLMAIGAEVFLVAGWILGSM